MLRRFPSQKACRFRIGSFASLGTPVAQPSVYLFFRETSANLQPYELRLDPKNTRRLKSKRKQKHKSDVQRCDQWPKAEHILLGPNHNVQKRWSLRSLRRILCIFKGTVVHRYACTSCVHAVHVGW